MKEIKVIHVGLFDSSIFFKNMKESKPRTVQQYEIEIFFENSGISIINSKKYTLEKGNVIIAKPGQVRNSIFPFKCYYIHLQPDEYLDKYLLHTPDMMKVGRLQILIDIIRTLMSYKNSPFEGCEILTQSKLLELIYHLNNEASMHNRKINSTHFIDHKIILKAIDFIEANFHTELSLETISKHVNLSPVYFHGMFTSAVGKTPHEYVIETRIKKAKDMLLTSEDSVATISQETGFTSQSYFSYVFKKQTGYTPNQFRAKKYVKDLI